MSPTVNDVITYRGERWIITDVDDSDNDVPRNGDEPYTGPRQVDYKLEAVSADKTVWVSETELTE